MRAVRCSLVDCQDDALVAKQGLSDCSVSHNTMVNNQVQFLNADDQIKCLFVDINGKLQLTRALLSELALKEEEA